MKQIFMWRDWTKKHKFFHDSRQYDGDLKWVSREQESELWPLHQTALSIAARAVTGTANLLRSPTVIRYDRQTDRQAPLFICVSRLNKGNTSIPSTDTSRPPAPLCCAARSSEADRCEDFTVGLSCYSGCMEGKKIATREIFPVNEI
jgi:hypothetical protein